MGPAIIVTTLTTVLFVGMILLLATKAKVAGKITGGLIIIVSIGGLLIYGYGYSQTTDNIALAVIRGILSVCGMFLGKNELSAISSAPLMQELWMLLIFWLLHLLAFYMTAGAAIVSVGSEALKKLRLWLARRGQMNLIYGVNDESVDLGKQLIRNKNQVVVFVDGKVDGDQMSAITGAGCVARTDADALQASCKFLKAIGLGRNGRKIVLYTLHKDSSANIRYARSFLASLQERGVSAEQTRLVILGQEEQVISRLQVREDAYGYGYVTAVSEANLAARLLIREYPPCRSIAFDENGAATENFEALIIGFGQTGQAVLKQLVMNGQFDGSRFRAAVFAPDCRNVDGFFSSQFVSVLENYEITFHANDGRSRELYEYLHGCSGKLRYVAVCTGSEKTNHEIAEELCHYFRNRSEAVPVYICSRQGVKAYGRDGMVLRQHKIYSPEMLSLEGLDRMAMILNYRYQANSERTALEEWMRCDYFSRLSCRASADFIGAMLHAVGRSSGDDWDLTPAQLENLSKTEHLRWCAFHFCMGFSAMEQEEFDQRAGEYLRQLRENGKASIRIGKNMESRTHACLVSWEELKDLSEKEAKITGKYTDYQDLDAQNVLAVPQLLKAAAEAEGTA